jgi:hypothetical protein
MALRLVELLYAQPILNLLPIRYLKPDEVLFVGTRDTQPVYQRLQNLVRDETEVRLTEVRDHTNPTAMIRAIGKKLRKLGWSPGDTSTGDVLVFNVSGGSRMMALATYALARNRQSRVVDAELVRGQYQLRLYDLWEHLGLHEDVTLPTLITIADYLKAHVPGFDEDGFSKDRRGRIDFGGRFEERIYRTLAPHVDEVLAGVRPAGVKNQIEIDLVVRKGNRVGIVEAKTGVKKAGIDQLDTAGNPRYLGEHIIKMLITGSYLPRAHKSLAFAQEIRVIELPSYEDRRGISPKDQQWLVSQVLEGLAGH